MVSRYPSDDINKFLWMVRIGGGVFPEIKERDYLGADGSYRIDDKAGKVAPLPSPPLCPTLTPPSCSAFHGVVHVASPMVKRTRQMSAASSARSRHTLLPSHQIKLKKLCRYTFDSKVFFLSLFFCFCVFPPLFFSNESIVFIERGGACSDIREC